MVDLKRDKVLQWVMALLLFVFVFGLTGVYYRIYNFTEWTNETIEPSTYRVNEYAYHFSDSAYVIDFGVQPLWIPASVITQVMRSDQVLLEMLEKQNVELRFHPFFQGADMMRSIMDGQLEGGVAGDMPVLMGMKHAQLEVVAPIQQGYTSIVSAKYSLIEDLKNKRIGCSYGTNAHFGFVSSMSLHGIDDQSYELVPMNIYQMIEALHQGEIDAFTAWEPIPSMAVHKYSEQVSIHKTNTMGFLFFTHEFCNSNPEVVKIIVAAELRAFNWLQASRNNLLKGVEWSLIETNRFLGNGEVELTNYQLSTLAKKDLLANADLPPFSNQDLDSAGFIQQRFLLLKQLGFVSDTISWSEIRAEFNQLYLPEIQKNPTKYRIYDFDYIPFTNSQNIQLYD